MFGLLCLSLEQQMKELTKAEEQIMQVLWDIQKGFVKDILEQLPRPKPAYNTVSTIVRILEKKGFVGYTAYGKTHEYYPLIAKNDYRSFMMKNMMKNYFSGSFEKMVSFFVKDNNVDLRQMEELMKNLQSENKDNDGSENS